MATKRRQWIQGVTICVVAAPAVGLAATAAFGDLGANPIETVTHVTGEWGLRFLLLALAVTPARRAFRWSWLAPLRRTLGLAAFGYATLHFLTYLALDHYFDWNSIAEDVLERRYVTAGFAAFLCMAPLAATSTRRAMKRLGQRWVTLHRLVYAAGVLAVVHFLWLVKADEREPLVYGAVLALLLGYRVWRRRPAGARPAHSVEIGSSS